MEGISATPALSLGVDSVASGGPEALLMTPDRSPDSLKFSVSMKVDAPLLRFLTGKRAKAKEKIEEETKTQLFVPFPHEAKKGSCLVVKGSSQEEVDKAVAQIQNILQEGAASPSLDYSHFISLPLSLHPALLDQVAKFQDSILPPNPTANRSKIKVSANITAQTATKAGNVMDDVSTVGKVEGNMSGSDEEDVEDQMDNDDELEKDKQGLPSEIGHGIDKSIFVKPTHLHLTVLMLKLWNKDLVAVAAEVLQGVRSRLLEALEGRPVAVRLTGLECMRGSPEKAHVLYVKVEEADKENRLARGCQVIIDAFSEAGLVSERDKKQKLKLHVTLMNTKYRKRKKGKRFSKQIPFDARQILIKYGLQDWGEHRIVEAHLSQRSAFGEDGYYRCCGSIQFPSASEDLKDEKMISND